MTYLANPKVIFSVMYQYLDLQHLTPNTGLEKGAIKP